MKNKALKPNEEIPETVTITLKKESSKYMALRQHIGSGEIEGHKVEASYNIGGGGPIIQIGEHTYSAGIESIVKEIFCQLEK